MTEFQQMLGDELTETTGPAKNMQNLTRAGSSYLEEISGRLHGSLVLRFESLHGVSSKYVLSLR